jgi:hypothetical protein
VKWRRRNFRGGELECGTRRGKARGDVGNLKVQLEQRRDDLGREERGREGERRDFGKGREGGGLCWSSRKMRIWL